MEYVDILTPPMFDKSGITKSWTEATAAGDWRGAFNIWVIQTQPVSAIVYQVRSKNADWEPNKLDVSAGGAYAAGESLWDGLREAKEEIGKDYNPEIVTYLGRRLNVSPDTSGRMRHTVIDVSIVEDNSPIASYALQEAELDGLVVCPLDELHKLYRQRNYRFTAYGLDAHGNDLAYEVTIESFPTNWDNYHYKMLLMAERYLNGEKNLLY